MHFAEPAWLLLWVLVAALAAVYAVLQIRRRRYVARFSNLGLLASVAPKRPGWRRHLTFGLLLVSLFVLVLGVAAPQAKVRVPREKATIMLAIDVSLSMEATDVIPTRLKAAQNAADEFADLLPPRINLGLVAFAGSASVKVPPTIDRDTFKSAVGALQLQERTGIGEGVFASLDAINTFSRATTAKTEKPAPARIVLLSDGTNNSGRSVKQAETAADSAKVPVSTIAFGTDQGTVDLPGFGVQDVPADKQTLQDLAQATGGSFNIAVSQQQLEKIYANIGSQIGYTTAERDISRRFLGVGLLFAIAAAGASLTWAGRLV